MSTVKHLYFRLDGIENKLHKKLERVGALLLAVSFVSIFIQITYRFILCKIANLPLSFTEELSRFCLFWLVYLMLPITMKEGLESTNTFLADRLKGNVKLILYILVWGICLFVAIVAFVFSFSVIATNWTYRSPALRCPGIFMYIPVTIGMFFVLLRYLIEALGLICREIEPFESAGNGGID